MIELEILGEKNIPELQELLIKCSDYLTFQEGEPVKNDAANPIRWIEMQWGVSVPGILRDIVPDYLEIGLLEYEEKCYFCRSPKQGILI